MADPDTTMGGSAAAYPETRHTVIHQAQHGAQRERDQALNLLLQVYWKPVYKHIRLSWNRSNEDAKDLTQGFFCRLLERDWIGTFDPAQASFRTYLRLCLDRYLAHQHEAGNRLKRGGNALVESFDATSATGDLERQIQATPAAAHLASPEDLFYQEWARSLFAMSVDRLQQECRTRGREQHFQLFEGYDLVETSERPSYRDLGQRLGLSETTVTNYLASARRDFRRTVLELLRELTATPDEYRAEAKRLLGVDA